MNLLFSARRSTQQARNNSGPGQWYVLLAGILAIAFVLMMSSRGLIPKVGVAVGQSDTAAEVSGAIGAAPPAPAPAAPAPAPAPLKDPASTNGLTTAALAGLDVAHTFGLVLVSGKRAGDARKSDHPLGRAIDVSNIAIGSPESVGGSPQMKAFAEHMRQEGLAGRLALKYIIRDGQIATADSGWKWRRYIYPGYNAASIEKLKQTKRGEYNRLQHFDHVHVSFKA